MGRCWEHQARGRACGWSAVQLDHDEEMGPLSRMYGTLDVELQVQRTIKKSRVDSFLVSFHKKTILRWFLSIITGLLMDCGDEK